jgi:hypothetical protein
LRQVDQARRNRPRDLGEIPEDFERPRDTNRREAREDEEGEEETLDYYEGDEFDDVDWGDAWDDAYDEVDDEEEDDYENAD